MRRRLLTQFYQQGLNTQYLTLVALVVTMIALWPVMDHVVLIAWCTWFVSLVLVRLFFMQKFLRNADAIEDVESWDFWGLIGTTLAGLSWGILGMAYDFTWPPFYQVFVLVLLGALASVSTAAYSCSLRANMLFIVSMLTPLFIRFLLDDAGTSHLFTWSIIVFVLCLWFVSFSTNKSVVDNAQLRLDNEKLIDNLSNTNTVLSREVDQRILAEEGLRQEQNLFTSGPVMVFRWRAEEGWPVEYASSNVSSWGLDANELMRNRTRFIHQYVHPEDMPKVIRRGYQNGENRARDFVELDYRIVLPVGRVKWVFERTIAVRDSNGQVVSINGYLLDITDRKQAENLLCEEKERAQATLQSIGDGVITTDNSARISYMNPAAESLTGVPLERARGAPLENVFRAVDQTTNLPIRNFDQHWHNRTRSEEMHAVRLPSQMDVTYSMTAITDSGRNTMGSVVVLRNATRAQALTRKLAYFASHDLLTHTLNRREFERCLNLAVKSAAQRDITHVLLYIDIDEIKRVNILCGHRAGDDLLQRVSDLLSNHIRSGDVIARLGGDEFAILLYRCSLDQAEAIAEKLLCAIRAGRFEWQDQVFELSVSMGAVEIDQHSDNVSALLSLSDQACFTAKSLGKNRLHRYHKTEPDLALRRSEIECNRSLNQAMKEQRLALYQRDIIAAQTQPDSIRRVEVLPYLFDGNGNTVNAGATLQAAENHGMTNAVDRWVVDECFGIIAEEMAAATTLYMVNVSVASVSQVDFVDHVKKQLITHSIEGSQICFQITAATTPSQLHSAGDFINGLKEVGCRFALAGLGNSLNSVASLKDLAVDYLKIAGSLVLGTDQDEVDRALVGAMIEVSRILHLHTIAEQIDNQTMMDRVRSLGIDFAQGEFAGDPKPFGRHARSLASSPRPVHADKKQQGLRAVK